MSKVKRVGPQQFTLKSGPAGGKRVWWVVGGDEVGTLYGAYRFAEKLGITSPAGRNTLGASTRLGKSKEVADDLNGYWVSRLAHSERRALTQLIGKQSHVSNERAAAKRVPRS